MHVHQHILVPLLLQIYRIYVGFTFVFIRLHRFKRTTRVLQKSNKWHYLECCHLKTKISSGGICYNEVHPFLNRIL